MEHHGTSWNIIEHHGTSWNIRVTRVIMIIIVIRVLKVNYYQSAFNSQKEKLNILAEMLEISKSGLAAADVV